MYLAGKFNRRVDYLLQTLLKIEQDLFIARQQKLLGLKTNRKAAKEGKRHDHGIQLSTTTLIVSESFVHF